MSVNKVYLLGNVGQNPELKTAKNGKAFCRINVATNEKHIKEDGEEVQKTTWHSVHVFGPQAEWACSRLQKGFRVFIEGRLDRKTEEDEAGQKKDTLFIRAFQVSSLAARPLSV